VALDVVLLGDRDTEFVTHRALDALIAQLPSPVSARWVASDAVGAERQAADADGLWLVPGGYADVDVVYRAVTHARTTDQPFLGTCAGFQHVIVEYARNVAGLSGADHRGADPGSTTAVIDRLACSLVGKERKVVPVAGTRFAEICGPDPFVGFHYCSFGLAPAYEEALVSAGLVIGAHADDAGVEAVELPGHRFFLATLFQPQMGALSGAELHPLIAAFLASLGPR
jgi:CTP synthase (UTP-ammonia lyase)